MIVIVFYWLCSKWKIFVYILHQVILKLLWNSSFFRKAYLMGYCTRTNLSHSLSMLKQIYHLIYMYIFWFLFINVSKFPWRFFLRWFPSLITLLLALSSIWYIALALQSHPINSSLCFRFPAFLVPRLKPML